MTLSRSKFEQLTDNLVERLREPFQKALDDANFEAQKLNAVVLVGGSTRMPMVQELVKQLTGKEPNRSVNPDEVVALGAALQAGVLAGDVNDVLLLDVTPLSLGLETLGSVMTTLIPRNTTIPTRKSEIFSTAEDGQSAVDIRVLQGERPLASDNSALGVFRLDGIPAAPRGIPQIEVAFDIDANGILNVSATDKATGKSQQITITASTNLSDSDVNQMISDAEKHADQDEKRRQLIDARNAADHIIYQTEKNLSSLNGQAPASLKQDLEAKINELREAKNGEDSALIQRLTSEIQQASMALGEAMYAEGTGTDGQETAGNGSNGSSHSTENEDEDIVEGEFEAI
jgi:molecular chaperone DnaK